MNLEGITFLRQETLVLVFKNILTWESSTIRLSAYTVLIFMLCSAELATMSRTGGEKLERSDSTTKSPKKTQ